MQITYTNVKPLVEALKEAGRIVLIAIIPLMIDGLTRDAIDWRGIGVVGAITLLRAIDKFLHIEGKLEDNASLTGGLTRF